MGDGKAVKNSRGATPNPAGEETGSYMPDGTPIDGTELSKPAPVSFVVSKDDAKSKDDVKDMKATKASSKATEENKTEKGSKADDLKSEKTTKATSKATLANKTEKGEKADNIKASHSVSFVVDKDDAKSKDDVKDEKATKASSKATIQSKTLKGSKADDLKSEKATKATSKATLANKTQKGEKAANIKASHSVSFMKLDDTYCSICDDMPDSDCYANLQQLYSLLDNKDRLKFLRMAYPNYDTTLSDGDCLTELEAQFEDEDSDTQFDLLKKGCVSDLEPTDADTDDEMETASFVVDKDDAKSKDDVKDMEATKASSKATEENKTEKGSKADDLKSEK